MIASEYQPQDDMAILTPIAADKAPPTLSPTFLIRNQMVSPTAGAVRAALAIATARSPLKISSGLDARTISTGLLNIVTINITAPANSPHWSPNLSATPNPFNSSAPRPAAREATMLAKIPDIRPVLRLPGIWPGFGKRICIRPGGGGHSLITITTPADNTIPMQIEAAKSR